MKQADDLANTLAAYVPAGLVRRLASDPAPIAVPSVVAAAGVCLFVDIVGFTPLTERLARAGTGGAERMAAVLNAVFEPIVATCINSGGEIMDFAGDALLVVWWSDAAEMEEEALRATQCALELQRIIKAQPPIEDTDIAVKISLTAGPAFVMHVGGAGGRKRSVVVGAPIERLAEIEHDSEPGRVVAAPEVTALLGNRYTGSSTPSGNSRIEQLQTSVTSRAVGLQILDRRAVVALSEYVPEIVQSRLGAGQDEWLAEYRRLTSVFVNVLGLRLTNPLDRNRLHEVVQAVQQVAHRYGGTIHQLTDGDKGMVVLVAYGLPPHAHEDDPARGVRAALEIEEVVAQHGLRSAIGISTGKAFTGPVGGDQRREYTVVGDAVNLAARLMQVAPDDILCDSVTARSYPAIEYETLEPLVVKGKREPVAVFRPHGDAPRILGRPGDDLPIVGRLAEQEQLAEFLENVRSGGSGSVVVVEGEAGIGKSRLLRNLAERATSLGIRVLAGSGSAIEQTTPYFGWRPILMEALELGGVVANPGPRRRHVLRWFRSASLPLEDAPLLNAVMGLQLPVTDEISGLPDEVRAHRARSLLLDMMAVAAGPEPALILLEDGHHLDSASWDLVAEIRDRLPHVSIAIAVRPAATPTDARRPDVIAASTHIVLDKLSRDETVDLVQRSLGVRSLPDSIRNLIETRTAGHPFFSEELAFALRDHGVITTANGTCRVTASPEELAQLTIPDTVQGVVTSRIDRLRAPAQTILKMASVVGYSIDAELLTSIHPPGEASAAVEVGLADLVRKSFIVEEPGTSSTYHFKHAIVRDVTYESLAYSQRQSLHRAIGGFLESRRRADHATVAVLGHHWFRAAGDGSEDTEALSKAATYLLQAGRLALGSGAFAEAEQSLQAALSCHQRLGQTDADPTRKVDILHHLSTATFAISGYGSPRTLAVTQQAYEAARGLVGPAELFPILWGLWISNHFSFATDTAVSIGEELMAIAEAEDDDEMRMQAHHALWTTLIQVPDYDRARHHIEEGVRLYRPEWHERHCAEFGGHDPGSCAQRALGLMSAATGSYGQAVTAGEIAVALAQDHAFSATSARLALAFIHHTRGDLDATEAESNALIELATRVRMPANSDWARMLLAWVHGQRGSLDAAIQEIVEIKDRLGMKDPGYLSMLVELLIAQGRGRESLELIDDLLAVVEDKKNRQYEAELHRLRGEALLLDATENEDFEKAEVAMREAAAIASRQGALSFELRARTSLARLVAGTNRAEEGINELQSTLVRLDDDSGTVDLRAARALIGAGLPPRREDES